MIRVGHIVITDHLAYYDKKYGSQRHPQIDILFIDIEILVLCSLPRLSAPLLVYKRRRKEQEISP